MMSGFTKKNKRPLKITATERARRRKRKPTVKRTAILKEGIHSHPCRDAHSGAAGGDALLAAAVDTAGAWSGAVADGSGSCRAALQR